MIKEVWKIIEKHSGLFLYYMQYKFSRNFPFLDKATSLVESSIKGKDLTNISINKIIDKS